MESRNYFNKCLEKGTEFELKARPELEKFANSLDCVLLDGEVFLPTENFRFNGLRFPDYVMIDNSFRKGKYRVFIEMKRKRGWFSSGDLYVTVEKNMIDDYMKVADLYNAPLVILIYCENNDSCYLIDDFSNMLEQHYDNDFGKNIAYKFFTNKLKEIEDFKNLLK